MDIIPGDAAGFWAMVGAIAIPVGAMIAELYRRLMNGIRSEIKPLQEQNQWLKDQLDVRLQLPTFARDAVELTEKGAERRIEELKKEHSEALRAKDEEKQAETGRAVEELEQLRSRLLALDVERSNLVHRVSGFLSSRRPVDSENGFGLPTGPILLVRFQGKVGALKAVDQASDSRGKFIRYAWWYLPDGSTDFSVPGVEFGFGETGEHLSSSPKVEIGPIKLTWSMGGDGLGWVYYGNSAGSPDYELAITREVDISRVDAKHFEFFPHPKYRKPRG